MFIPSEKIDLTFDDIEKEEKSYRPQPKTGDEKIEEEIKEDDVEIDFDD